MHSMDEGAIGWLHRIAVRNHWRVASWIDLSDLIQDGYLHWQRIAQRYPDAPIPAQMRLFQITYLNWFHDLAKRKLKQVDIPFSAILQTNEDESRFLEQIGIDDELSSATALIGKVPERVEYLLRLILMKPFSTKRLKRLLKTHRNIAYETYQFLSSSKT